MTNSLGAETDYFYGDDTYLHGGQDIDFAIPRVTYVVSGAQGASPSHTWIQYGPFPTVTQDLPTAVAVASIVNPPATAPGPTPGPTPPIANQFLLSTTYNTNGSIATDAASGSVINADGSKPFVTYATNFTSNAYGQLLTRSGPLAGELETVQYFTSANTTDRATLGQPMSVTIATQATSSLTWQYAASSGHTTYDIYGNPTSTIDPNNVAEVYGYDPTGRPTQRTLVGTIGSINNPTLNWSYDAAGLPQGTVTPLGNAINYGYDADARLSTVTRLDSSNRALEQMLMTYTEMSHVASQSSLDCPGSYAVPPQSCSTWTTEASSSFIYDNTRELVSQVVEPLPAPASSAAATLSHDQGGNLQTVSHFGTTATLASFGFDASNRQTSSNGADGTGNSYTLAYDPSGRALLTSVSGGVPTVAYQYDDFGRLDVKIDPVTGTQNFQYDADGNLTFYKDSNGNTTNTSYDLINRALVSTTVSNTGTDTTSRTYDDPTAGHFGLGRLTSIADPVGVTSFVYNPAGWIVARNETISTQPYNFAFGYDADGNMTSVTYPSGRTVSYNFDYADRPISASDSSVTFVSSATYLPFGPLTSIVYGNGSVRQTTYDQRYVPTENFLKRSATGPTIIDYSYGSDPDGDITSISDKLTPSGAYDRTFVYDGSNGNQLSQANSGSGLWGSSSGTYRYYQGNPTNIPIGTSTLTVGYGNSDAQPTSSMLTGGNQQNFSYDAVGNALTYGSTTFTYSPRELLATGGGFQYTYDASGIREITQHAGSTRYSFYSLGENLLEESNVASGTPTPAFDFVWFGDIPVAQVDISGTTNTPHWTFDDPIGTPIAQTDASASLYWRAEYSPRGDIYVLRVGSGSSIHQPLRFPGMEAEQFSGNTRNGDTGKFYNIHRWYNYGIGLYFQSDPLIRIPNEQYYRYAANNPQSYTDPTGLILKWGNGDRTTRQAFCTDYGSSIFRTMADQLQDSKNAYDIFGMNSDTHFPTNGEFTPGGIDVGFGVPNNSDNKIVVSDSFGQDPVDSAEDILAHEVAHAWFHAAFNQYYNDTVTMYVGNPGTNLVTTQDVNAYIIQKGVMEQIGGQWVGPDNTTNYNGFIAPDSWYLKTGTDVNNNFHYPGTGNATVGGAAGSALGCHCH